MGKMSKKEKEEMLRMADSAFLRNDMKHISKKRFNPVMTGCKIDMDRLITFLTEYNAFINHRPKPFKPMKDMVTMRL